MSGASTHASALFTPGSKVGSIGGILLDFETWYGRRRTSGNCWNGRRTRIVLLESEAARFLFLESAAFLYVIDLPGHSRLVRRVQLARLFGHDVPFVPAPQRLI